MRIEPLLDQPRLDDRFPLPLDRPFTAATARAAGVSRFNLGRLIDAGHLRSPVRGTFLATQAGDSIRLRAESLALVVPEDCVVCDRHAGWLHGADMILAPGEHQQLRPISVFRPSGHGRLRNDLADSGERNLRPRDVTVVGGVLVTTPVRTTWDLGRQRSRDAALSCMDQMFRLGRVDRDEFLDGIPRFRGMRWVTRLRELAPYVDGRAASPGESCLRLRWIDAGLPLPELQVEVWVDGVLLAIIDLACEELRYGAEYDGEEWHSTAEQVAHDRARRDELGAQRWLVDVFRRDDVHGRTQSADRTLRAGYAAARAARGAVIA
ncbi:hypothetical protein [Nocardioides dongxiaopingii]|uniref:hypothetical protein n=1 Tax=Nocardioides dongxiaopingii TaxID=2576036 RepID=UPI0010C76833|nr:hypothetical protein [Nocardioides dongxiaopingii]